MYRVENVYRLLPPDFFQGNYETYVVNTEDGHMLAFNRKTKHYNVVKQTTELFFYRNNRSYDTLLNYWKPEYNCKEKQMSNIHKPSG